MKDKILISTYRLTLEDCYKLYENLSVGLEIGGLYNGIAWLFPDYMYKSVESEELKEIDKKIQSINDKYGV